MHLQTSNVRAALQRRKAALTAAAATLGASRGLAFGIRFDLADRRLRATGGVTVGVDEVAPADGMPLQELGQAPEALPDLAGGVVPVADMPPLLQARMAYLFAADAATGWLAVDDGALVGVAWVLHSDPQCPALAKVRAVGPRLTQAIVDTDRALEPPCPSPTRTLLRPDGRVWMHDGNGDALPEQVRHLAREHAATDAQWSGFLGSLRVRVDRVSGGTTGIVVCTEPMVRTAMCPFLQLRRIPRRVAALAARGQSLKAIGHRLGRSRETIKHHLDHIYDTLAIGSRAELVFHYLRAAEGQPHESVTTPGRPPPL